MLVYTLLHFSIVQSYATGKVINYLANEYNIKVSIRKLNIKLPAKIGFEGFYVEDQAGDTLLFTEGLFTKISDIKIWDREVYLEKIELTNPYLNVYVDTLGISNVRYLQDLFSSTDTSDSDGFNVYVNEFELISARLKYNDYTKTALNNEFDPSHIDISGLNFGVGAFQLIGDTIEFDIHEFSFNDHSGVCIQQLSTHLVYHSLGISLYDLEIITPNSYLKSSSFSIAGSDADYLTDPMNKMRVGMKIDTCILAFNDIRFFLPDIARSNEKIQFSGNIQGEFSDIKLKDIIIRYGYQTHLSANLSINGLPDLESTFIFGDIENMQVSVYDMETLSRTLMGGKDPMLPANLYRIGLINFKGNISGLYDDIVAYGEFNAPTGSIKTDISVARNSKTGITTYKGSIKGNKLNIGHIMMDDKTFGKISFATTLNGTIDTLNNFAANINMTLSQLGILGYDYSNIAIKGSVSNTMFNGELLINDPNLNVEFIGKYDVHTGIPLVDFSSSISANLDELHLDTINSELSVLLIADFMGEDINSLDGLVQMRNLQYIRDNDTAIVEVFDISIGQSDGEQFIKLKSDIFDAEMRGIYDFFALSNSLPKIVNYYLPSLSDFSSDYFNDEYSHFNFELSFQNLDEITDIFLPKLSVSDTIKISGGVYNDVDSSFASIIFPDITYDTINMLGGEASLVADRNSLSLHFNADSVFNSKYNFAENLIFSMHTFSDSILINLNWNDYEELNYSGDINLLAILDSSSYENLPKISSFIYPSYFVVANNRWDIDSSAVIIDTTEIEIQDFIIKFQNQSLRLDGYVSEAKDKLLRFYVSNVDLSNFNPLLVDSGYELGGDLNASGRIASLYGSPIFKTNLSINSFKINQEDFGRFDIAADWLENESGFRVMGSNYFLKFNGNYMPKQDSINIFCDINNFNLKVFDPYLRTVEISDTKGLADGSITINGNIKSPNIVGFIDFEKAELTYDYLKLHVVLDDTIRIEKDKIAFNDFVVKDNENHKGVINGGVYHTNFKDISFNFDIKTDSLKIMNTTETDNQLFYGRAYATGDINISGNMQEFGISVDAKTAPNTVFVLPMTDSFEAGDNSILTFVLPASDTLDKTLSVVSLPPSFKYFIDLNIELTPDAEAQIVFDPKVGDMIRGNCKGNINLYYDSDETFSMVGDVEIVDGSYLFTMQNIINKKFDVEPGGSIIWSGDPYEASLNLNAVYNVRAPLKELMMGIDTSDMYKKLTNVECIIHMKESLMAPLVSFDINIPSADEKVKSQLMSLSEDEKNKQVLYLLIMNRFYTPDYMQTDATGGGAAIPVGMTASEWASNQISNWLSQISKDFDIGIKYRPGDEVTPQEVEVALSTQLFNDRILIDGNVGLTEQQSAATNIVGNVDVQWKINKNGNLRLKGYNHANSEIDVDYGPYTQGVGIFYTEDFNTFGGLFKKYWDIITFKKRRNKENK